MGNHLRAAFSANLLQSADTYRRLANQEPTKLHDLEQSQADANAGAAIWGAVVEGLLTEPVIVERVDELTVEGHEGPDSPDAGTECANLFYRAMSDFIYPMGGAVAPYYHFGDWDLTPDDEKMIRQRELQSQASGCCLLAQLIKEPVSGTSSPVAVVKVDDVTEARDKWLYKEAMKGTVWGTIRLRLDKKPKTWGRIDTDKGARVAARRYAGRHNLPLPAARKHGRPGKRD